MVEFIFTDLERVDDLLTINFRFKDSKQLPESSDAPFTLTPEQTSDSPDVFRLFLFRRSRLFFFGFFLGSVFIATSVVLLGSIESELKTELAIEFVAEFFGQCDIGVPSEPNTFKERIERDLVLMEEVSDLFTCLERHVGTDRFIFLDPSRNSVDVEDCFTETTFTFISETTEEDVVVGRIIPIYLFSSIPHDLEFVLGAEKRKHVLRHRFRFFRFHGFGIRFFLFLTENLTQRLEIGFMDVFVLFDLDRMPRTCRSKSHLPLIPYINRNISVFLADHLADIFNLGFDGQTDIEHVVSVFSEVFDLLTVIGLFLGESCFVKSIATMEEEDTTILSCTVQSISYRDIVDRSVVRFSVIVLFERVNSAELDLLILARFFGRSWLWRRWRCGRHRCRSRYRSGCFSGEAVVFVFGDEKVVFLSIDDFVDSTEYWVKVPEDPEPESGDAPAEDAAEDPEPDAEAAEDAEQPIENNDITLDISGDNNIIIIGGGESNDGSTSEDSSENMGSDNEDGAQ